MADNFPPYSFVPGHWPHPTRDPEGHSYGIEPDVGAALDLEDWQRCDAYLRGVDLFNAGYYWEAHEVWEEIWKALGREGVTAELLQALIKLTAVGVKIRQGYGGAALSLLQQATTHFRHVHTDEAKSCVAGITLEALISQCERLSHEVEERRGDPTLPVETVLAPLVLEGRP